MAWRPLRNIGLKLAALVLGVALWITVSGQQVERNVLVQLQFRNVPPSLEITGDTPRTVDVRVRGAAGLISPLEPYQVVATIDVTDARPGVRVFPLTAEHISVPLGVEVKSVDPSTISLTLEKSATAQVQVKPTIDGLPAPGYDIGDVTWTPRTVDVVGPESRLKDHPSAITERISVDGATATVAETVNMAVTDPSVRLRQAQSARVIVTIVPAPVARLPGQVIVFHNLPAGRQVTADPAAVAVTLRGPHKTLTTMKDEQLQPYVDLASLGPGQYSLQVHVDPHRPYPSWPSSRPRSVSGFADQPMSNLFGTDGIRGVAGSWPLDPPTVARVGAAIVRALPTSHPPRLVVGRDTRESGEWIERELARGAGSQGATVVSAGIIPTPAVAYLARTLEFDLGVVISASHNPYQDNGIKVFSGRGEKFGVGEERAVETIVADATWAVSPAAEARLERANLLQPYFEHIERILPTPGPLAGARIGVDMANGATTTTARRVLEAAGFDLCTLGDAPDGHNINLACGSTHPAGLSSVVVAHGCRLGVAFDGDGDRAILVDHRGRVIDGDAVLLMLALHYQRQGRLYADTVVATVMSNIGLEIALRDRGIHLVRTAVGDKHVMEAMLQSGYVLGGEQSGHVILSEHLFTGDGLATTLAVLRVLAETGRTLADLASDLVTLPADPGECACSREARRRRGAGHQGRDDTGRGGAGRTGPAARALLGYRAAAAHHD